MPRTAKAGPILLAALFLIPLSACAGETNGPDNVLRILNAEDYIYLEKDPGDAPDMMEQWVDWMRDTYGEKVSYVYDTFDTNETMFNELKTGKVHYDVIVPSDYMIQKMMSLDMLEPFDRDLYDAGANPTLFAEPNNVGEYVSPYLKDIFRGITAKDAKTGEERRLDHYAVPYMWGTVGLIYNPAFRKYVERGLDPAKIHADFKSWDVMYDHDYRDSIFVKDSVRDTYIPSIIHVNEDEMNGYLKKLHDGEITPEEYNELLTEVFNRADDATLELVRKDMDALKENSFGFEVDSGKQDITTGKVGGDLAWSGDAVWSMFDAEKAGLDLYYSVPGPGSNVWFDAMCMPKGAKVELAEKFMNFISAPGNAVQNMDYVGYTPGIAGEEVLEYVYETYDVRGGIGAPDPEGADYAPYDLSYFFADTVADGTALLHACPDYIGRQLSAQYPTKEELTYLAVMKDFGAQNEAVLSMWEAVRTNGLPVWAIAVFSVEIAGALAFMLIVLVKRHRKRLFRAERRRKRLAE